MIGARLGAFLVEEKLGEGAFAEVFRARHPSGQLVALKVGREGTTDGIREEAERLASFDHPGIVHVHDHGAHQGRSWLALELARGTLAELRVPVPLTDLAGHLLRAVGHLHARGVVHRDLKPTNILIGCAPRTGLDAADRAGIRLADFGIAWAGGRAIGLSSGTPGWAAPEQTRGVVHPSADVLAVARILRAMADPGALDLLESWFQRALSPEVADRFPSAAHALASLPGIRSTVQPALPRDTSRTLPSSPVTPLETSTRPVLLALSGVPAAEVQRIPIVEPTWPLHPPVPAVRRPRAEILDAGLALVPWRAVLPVGRLDLLLGLWEVARVGDVLLDGAPDDVDEVEALLVTWIAETGLERRVARGPGGVHVGPLEPWHLAARAENLGFEPTSAARLADGATSARILRGRILEIVRAGLVDVTDEGLRVRAGVGEAFSGHDLSTLEAALEEAWWSGDAFGLARTIAELRERARESDNDRLSALVELGRAWAEKRRDAATVERLAGLAEHMRADARLRAALLCEAAGTAVRNRDAVRARQLLERLGEPADPRLAATARLHWGFVAFLDRDPAAREHLEAAMVLADGRYRPIALATLADVCMQRGEREQAVLRAREAMAAVSPDRADEVMLTCSALVVALANMGGDEAEITALLDHAGRAAERALNRSALARLQLLKAQQAMRLEVWDRADRLLSEAQAMFVRCGGSATFVVLNHGLVGLQRGDLASIAAITPPGWDREVATAPAYVRLPMLLHSLFAALGADDDATIEGALAALEGEAIPQVALDSVRLARALAPRWAARLDALAGGDPG